MSRARLATGALVLLGSTTYLLLPPAVASVAGTAWGALCLVLLVLGARRRQEGPRSRWWLLTGGLGLFVAGDAIYTGYDLRGTELRSRESRMPSTASATRCCSWPWRCSSAGQGARTAPPGWTPACGPEARCC